MPGADATHWLHRLTAAEWLAAASTELVQGDEALARRSFRPAVTHARRAAGMALNALLVAEDHPWGRSYMEHLVAAASDLSLPEAIRRAAQQLRETPAAAPTLVKLGAPDRSVLQAAHAILHFAATTLSAQR